MTEEEELAKEHAEKVGEFLYNHGSYIFYAIKEIIDLNSPKEEPIGRIVKLNLAIVILTSVIYNYFPPESYERIIDATLHHIRDTLAKANKDD